MLFWKYIRKTWEKNRIENRITLKIKKGYYVEFLSPEAIKLPESTTSKITKDKNGENVPYLEITEVVSIHCNFVNNSYLQNLSQTSWSC